MEKLCHKCKVSKSLAEFSKNKSKPDGLEYNCRPCLRLIRNTNRNKNKQHANAWKSQWKKAHPDNVKRHYRNYYHNLSPEGKAHRRHYGRAYRHQHRDRIKFLTQQWGQANLEHRRRYARRYCQDPAHRARHYKRMLVFTALRRAREAAAIIVDKVDVAVLYARDKGICSLCHQKVDRADASSDHIIPLSKGGEHSYRNTALAHLSCNCRKKDRIAVQQMRLF